MGVPTPEVTDVELQTFNFDTLPVRVVMDGDQPWFVAVDVALILGYRNSPDATRLLDADEKGTHIVHTPGGAQEMTTISESGLFNLVLRSRRPEARPFRRWVTGDVLPTLRRTGTYSVSQAVPQTLPEALRLAADLAEQREQLLSENALLAPKAQVYDALIAADGTYAVGDAAKLLGTGELKLFRTLRERQVLMDGTRSGVEHHNLPYQRFLDAGYFTVVTRPRPGGDTGRVSQTTRVTAKGLAWLQRSLERQGLLLARPA
ncbi:phage antirepressor KilAC domain-containing protein [uncultured Deinococcus sp.]|uniref:phage antirepressor KilAC domain-containing protein n=1 Tax=uncultured Deinococcus sp. TaxID=158789 RepID=UPI0025CD73B8|nr:phage antirepressor KilAC domain-containing protein [uncultured Deinococcus sp.]